MSRKQSKSSEAATKKTREATTQTMVAMKCVEEETRKWEEAKRKSDETEKDFMSTTKRAASTARELGNCVCHVAPGNPTSSTTKEQHLKEIMENIGMCCDRLYKVWRKKCWKAGCPAQLLVRTQ